MSFIMISRKSFSPKPYVINMLFVDRIIQLESSFPMIHHSSSQFVSLGAYYNSVNYIMLAQQVLGVAVPTYNILITIFFLSYENNYIICILKINLFTMKYNGLTIGLTEKNVLLWGCTSLFDYCCYCLLILSSLEMFFGIYKKFFL